MSLRDEIGDLIRTLTRGDPDGSGFVIGVDPCSDAIFDLVLTHATSEDALDRADEAFSENPTTLMSRHARLEQAFRAAITAALSEDKP